jgi:hypothetical protein
LHFPRTSAAHLLTSGSQAQTVRYLIFDVTLAIVSSPGTRNLPIEVRTPFACLRGRVLLTSRLTGKKVGCFGLPSSRLIISYQVSYRCTVYFETGVTKMLWGKHWGKYYHGVESHPAGVECRRVSPNLPPHLASITAWFFHKECHNWNSECHFSQCVVYFNHRFVEYRFSTKSR